MNNQRLQTIIDGTIERTIHNMGVDMISSKDSTTIKSLVSAIIVGVNDMLQGDVELKVKRTDDAKEFPLIAIKKHGDVGFDLPAVMPIEDGKRTSVVIEPGCRTLIPTGISLEIPEGYWVSIEARSSTSKQSIIVPKGVIDEGYRGELFAQLINVGNEPREIFHGDRYIQMIIHKRENARVKIVEVDELSPSERGATGFGSTGQSENTNGQR